MSQHHGGTRGLETTVGSALFEGRFGRMFRPLPAAEFGSTTDDSVSALHALAQKMTASAGATPKVEGSPALPSGYTFLGQFIDHDLTFDPVSSLQKANDPDSLTNFRSPRFDLDCIYGRGPDDQPYMYQQDGPTKGSLLLGRPLTGATTNPDAKDLARAANGRAIIGDMRNDENVIISQIQSTFIRFHNRCIAKGFSFAEAQRQTRWHYQYVVLNDFLPRIVGRDTVEAVLPHLKKGTTIYEDTPNLNFYHWHNDPFMPVEFAVAAYRFGHSLVRERYMLNSTITKNVFDANDQNGLNGFRAFPADWAIDWTKFFEEATATGPKNSGFQPADCIDTSLVNPLAHLPGEVGNNAILADRNLLRGYRMGLPSGQAVAKAMAIVPHPDTDIRMGRVINNTWDNAAVKITDVSAAFANNCPLWAYILAEAAINQVEGRANTLGPVGGRIVAEVIVGLLLGDQYSYLSQDPNWTPYQNKNFGMPDFIHFALSPLPVVPTAVTIGTSVTTPV